MNHAAACTAGHEPAARLPRVVWLLSWVSFFADVSSEMIYPIIPLFLVGVLGSTMTQLGLVEGLAALIVAIVSAWAGLGSDRMRRRAPWIRWGYGLPIAGKSLIALAHAWPVVLAGRLLDRLGKGLRGAPRDALITDAVSPAQRGRAFGLHRAFDNAGALAGILLSALLLWWLSGYPRQHSTAPTDPPAPAAHDPVQAAQAPAWVYRSVFAVGAGLGLISLILTLLVREPRNTQAAFRDEIRSHHPPPAAAATAAAATTIVHLPAACTNLPARYWLLLGLFVLFSLGNSSDTFLLLRASELGYSPWTVVLIYATYNLTAAAAAYPAGRFSDRFGRWRVIGAGWLIYGGVYVGFALLPPTHSWGVWALMACYGFYLALTEGVGKALISDHAPAGYRGLAMGLFYAATGITTLGASLITGVLWDRWGPQAAFLTAAGVAGAALLGVILVSKVSNRGA